LVMGGSVLGLFADPRAAWAELSDDLKALKGPDRCNIATQGAGKIPFICFDLAGGANIAGSNVLVGKQDGQLDSLDTAGYSKLGLAGDMLPNSPNPLSLSNNFINTDLGLAFHRDSAMLQGILEKMDAANLGSVNGAIIPARSDNDTGNNPHNPMYGIHRAGANGALLTLIGSESSDSGGNSMAPASMLDNTVRPTKVSQGSDVTGLIDTGKLVGLLNQEDAVAVMESIQRISDMKLNTVDTKITSDDVIKELVRCGYVKAADLADRYGDPSVLDPTRDTNIVGPTGIFSDAEYSGDREFRKAAAVMKMVINGFAGAGTIEMGGFDYHTGDRITGELRDLRAGQCMGACLEYAARVGVPLMMYVFSDGSVASNGMIDPAVGKPQWTGDNSSTAASFFLVYNPGQRPALYTSGSDLLIPERHQQIGYFRGDGSVETAATAAASNVNLLAEALILNYMALHGEQGNFSDPGMFPNHGLGSVTRRDELIAFEQIVNGTIAPPT
ncbi:MAG: hypothetical protein ACR2P6_00980, partial [Gammaproteobacteria bacterium]